MILTDGRLEVGFNRIVIIYQTIIDNGGRRLGIDRRQLSIPKKGRERRFQNERRPGADRREKWSYQEDNPEERRSSFYIK